MDAALLTQNGLESAMRIYVSALVLTTLMAWGGPGPDTRDGEKGR